MKTLFENPCNGHRAVVSDAGTFLGNFFLGSLYFLIRGRIGYFFLSLLISLCTCGLARFVFPLIAPRMLRSHYEGKGYTIVEQAESNWTGVHIVALFYLMAALGFYLYLLPSSPAILAMRDKLAEVTSSLPGSDTDTEPQPRRHAREPMPEPDSQPAAPSQSPAMAPTAPSSTAPAITQPAATPAPAPVRYAYFLAHEMSLRGQYGTIKVPAGTPLTPVSQGATSWVVRGAGQQFTVPASEITRTAY